MPWGPQQLFHGSLHIMLSSMLRFSLLWHTHTVCVLKTHISSCRLFDMLHLFGSFLLGLGLAIMWTSTTTVKYVRFFHVQYTYHFLAIGTCCTKLVLERHSNQNILEILNHQIHFFPCCIFFDESSHWPLMSCHVLSNPKAGDKTFSTSSFTPGKSNLVFPFFPTLT